MTAISANLFRPASKQQSRARVAFSGPSGSGKTYWALQWATVLAAGRPIAVIDTERGSASLYADRFKFDVLQMQPPYHPDRLVEALKQAEQAQYAVVVIDSQSHFWNGQGGVLEIVDEASARLKGNSWAGWSVGTPIQQKMVDAMLGFDGHVISTMRSKTEWLIQDGANGKKTPVKIGLAPQQRDNMDFEFTVFFEIDAMTHRASPTKSRFDGFRDKTFGPEDSIEAAETFASWLQAGAVLIDANTADSIKQRIDRLDKDDRAAVSARWAALGLPSIKQLTVAHLEAVEEVLKEAPAFTQATVTPIAPIAAAPIENGVANPTQGKVDGTRLVLVNKPQPEPSEPLVSEPQIKQIRALLRGRKIVSSADQLATAKVSANRELDELIDLTEVEATALLDALRNGETLDGTRHTETLAAAYDANESADPVGGHLDNEEPY